MALATFTQYVLQNHISRLIEFAFDVRKGWRPQHAACSSDSLTPCLNRFRELAAKMQ
jgi:hypothetical protein